MKSKIKMFDLVVPKEKSKEWEIGKVIGMSRFELSIGPLLLIRDLVSGKTVERFPLHVDRLVREKDK